MTSINVHAGCVVLDAAGARFGAPADAGVLLIGDSGSGKSDVALRLIAMGARLVADDRADFFARGGYLWARPPQRLAGLIEVRGLGIVALPFAAEARIALAVRLVPSHDLPRLPEPEVFEPPPSLAVEAARKPPLIRLAAHDVSAPERIVLAAAAFANALFRA